MSSPDREQERDPYWWDDIALGEAPVYRQVHTIRARIHTASERFHRHHELVPLTETTGTRVYVHAKPYILIPDITLTVGLYRQPDAQGAIGAVRGSEWEGLRHEDIGNCQGWFYPTDRLVMLWEAFVEDRFRQADPREDPAMLAVWQGFERFLVSRFPTARQLVTPWEDLYARPTWQTFVESQGYRPFTPATFVKDIPSSTESPTQP